MSNNISPQYNKMITVKKRNSNRKGNYLLGETIGKGAFAKVKLATHIPTQEKVAIKILDKQKLSHHQTQSDVVRIKKEINILKQLRHKNIIQLYEIMESQSNLYIVMEYCEGKELFDYIIKRKHLPEREACRFFQQIINGVEYLHLMNVTHRDLKPENLLLDSKKRIKISDFGLSTISQNDNSLLQTPCGTPSYAPPEMLRGDEYNGVESDIWSCGIILYTMLCGNLPCAESKEELIYQTLVTHNYDFPSYVSNLAVDLINNMLKVEPNERYTFEQVKSHPWFNLVQPQLKPGLLVGNIRIPIDEEVLDKVEGSGFDREKCKESIRDNKYDAYTAFYYLSLKQMSREGKSSISDLFSDEYVKYIKDSSNWDDSELINDSKYKDYWDDEKIRTERAKYDTLTSRKECINRTPESTFKQVKKKIVSLIGHNYSNNKNTSIISLKLSSDPLTQDLKDKIIDMIKKSNELFNKQLEYIDNIDNLPFKSKNDTTQHNANNLITLIANRLIKTSIFGKYLVNTNKKANSLKIPIKGELVDKFYTLQKYKNLVDVIKSRRIGIFPKKIYDWNYYTFDEFLNDEEDYVFTDNFMKSSIYTSFINKIKRGMRKPINANRSAYKNYYYSSKRYNSAEKYPNLNRSSIMNNSAYYKRTNKITLSTKRPKRVNKFISISTYIHENSVERNGSSSGRQLNHSYYKRTTEQKPKITSYSSSKNRVVQPFGFKISTSTMNDISEDDEIFNFNNNFIDTHRKSSCEINRKKESDEIKSNLAALITEGNELTEHKETIEHKSNVKPVKVERSTDEIINSIKQFKSEIQSTKPKIPKPHTRSVAFMGKEMSSSSYNTSSNESYYTGPIDIRCVMISEKNELISEIRSYFKKLDFFCNVKGNRIKCSKANLNFEIELTKISLDSNSNGLNYIKLKLRTGESAAYQKTINEMLNNISN